MNNKTCTKCKSTKNINEFGSDKESKDGHRSRCKACLAIDRKEYRLKNYEKSIQRVREWRNKNRETLNENRREWYKQNREQQIAETREWRLKLRKEVLVAYGNICACCGEDRIEFLSIDHINGGGNKERKKLKLSGGVSFYQYLRKNNFPKGYRVLCHNCNMARGLYGYCPHEDK